MEPPIFEADRKKKSCEQLTLQSPFSVGLRGKAGLWGPPVSLWVSAILDGLTEFLQSPHLLWLASKDDVVMN